MRNRALLVLLLGLCPAFASAQPRSLQEFHVVAWPAIHGSPDPGHVVYHLDIPRDPTLYLSSAAPETRRLFSQYLLSYKINPQTVFLVGYSDYAAATEMVDLTRTDRTFFTKVGYAWVR